MRLIKISFVIIGAKIGAGFASGKEIFEYFAKYGVYSLFFVIPMFIFFYWFTFICLKFGSKRTDYNIKNSNKQLSKNVMLFGKDINIYDTFFLLTFLILCSAMFSGMVSLFITYFGYVNKSILYLIVAVISIALINLSFTSLSTFSYYIVPLIILGIIINTIFTFQTNSFALSFGITNILPLPASTALYVSQNTFLASYVIIKSGSGLNNKQTHIVSFIVSFCLSLLMILGIFCFLFNPTLAYCEMPFAEISQCINPIFSYIFGFIIFSSIITTYATTLTSLKQFFPGDKKYNKKWQMLVLIVLLSLLHFGHIVKYLYPLIGVFGVIYIYKLNTVSKLSFEFSFNQANNAIHNAGQNTQNNRAC